jgi:D-alanyl-lipoteichoic acid acyltransferase DltB (MBOAT superfamily)
MSLTSLGFFMFLSVTFALYYLVPRFQREILLAGSLFFYFSASAMGGFSLAIVIGYIFCITYFGAFLIEKYRREDRKRNLVTFLCVAGLTAGLFVLKYAFNLSTLVLSVLRVEQEISWLNFVAVMGMSYFTLSAIGYLMDVSWGTYGPERNAGMVALFLFYFPALVSGPVVRFGHMREQYRERHALCYDNVAFGLRRMVWGYFKKLVISDRFGLVVSGVYGDLASFGGADILIATLCYAVQLYTDFSGCMDIVLGASQLFGISLPENFNAPFLSRTVQEFWQRWHITLGVWFKDYVMYPMQKSKHMVQLGKRARKRLGKKTGRKLPFYLSMVVLWFLIGIWHGGTGYYFMASAVIPFFLLMGGDLLQPVFEKLKKLLKIRKEGWIFRLFQRARTLLLICVCWVFVCAAGTAEGFAALGQALTHPFRVHIGQIIGAENLGRKTLVIFGLAILLGAIEYILQERGTSIKEFLDRRRYGVRVAVLYAELLLILLVGMVGNSAFIYFQF